MDDSCERSLHRPSSYKPTVKSLAASLRRWRLSRSSVNTLAYDLDCLVFSSHKTGTQTITATLRNSGMRVQQMHSVGDVCLPLMIGSFQSYLRAYMRRNRRKLTILSVFRIPLERHVSSFFQWHGDGVVRRGRVNNSTETIIARCPNETLQKIFIESLATRVVPGATESLLELCRALDYAPTWLKFAPERGFIVLEDDLMRVALFRFDLLFPDFINLIQEALQTKLRAKISNISKDKWYAKKYDDFKRTLFVPHELIHMVCEDKKDLIDIFYPSAYHQIVTDQIARYGSRAQRQ